jgi:hypothetical protein
MKEGSKLAPEYVTLQRADFYRFFNEYDKRNIGKYYYSAGMSMGTDTFLESFPQMKEFWNECKYHAENS